MEFTNSTRGRLRILDNSYIFGWQSSNELNDAADEIINTPEKYLLSQKQLYEAEGGNAGLAVQIGATSFGVATVFLGSPLMS